MPDTKRYFFVIFILLFSISFSGCTLSKMTEKNARVRMEKFIIAVNENKPEAIYEYLTPEIKEIIDKEGFIKNFKKERSYPYLTPLYLYLDKITLSEDKKRATAECTVAARLPGEKMTFSLYFRDGNYYIEAFREIADGSYLEKFKKL